MSQFGSALQETFVQRFRKNRELRRKRFAAITTRAQAEAYVAEIRAKLRAIYPPVDPCDPAPRLVKTLEKPDCFIDKIIYFSRPDFPVSALLYRPKQITGRVPGIALFCGHSRNGKAFRTYQQACRNFAQRGCIVLCPDPLGQGERLQFRREDAPLADLTSVFEHNAFNRKLVGLGEHYGSIRANDCRKAIDVLLARPDVDPARIGINGISGGGTMTSIVNMLEDRVTAAAPGCYITTWLRNVENELPVDAEQIPPGAAMDGCEMADLLLAAAPRPIRILGASGDFFDIRGAQEAYEELRHIYRLLGAEDKVSLAVSPGTHGYSQPMRENAIEFFQQVFDLTGPLKETEADLLSDEECFCTPGGLTIDLPGTRTFDSFVREELDAALAARPVLPPEELRKSVASLLKITLPVPVPEYRVLRPRVDDGKMFSRFALETEPDLPVTMQVFIPGGCRYALEKYDDVLLHLPHQDSAHELNVEPLPADRLCIGLDYRGVGESLPAGCDQGKRDFFALYRHDYHFASLGLLAGEEVFSGRVRDALGAIQLLRAQGTEKITLTGRGIGLYVAVFAAFLDGKVKLIFPEGEAPLSYAEGIRRRFDPIPQSMIPFGILKLTDVDELAALALKN